MNISKIGALNGAIQNKPLATKKRTKKMDKLNGNVETIIVNPNVWKMVRKLMGKDFDPQRIEIINENEVYIHNQAV
jgi:hypothetical protein